MKTLKRSLAAILAVLMAVFSVPFTASAADLPNIELRAYNVTGSTNKILWGPVPEEAYVDPLSGTIEAGSQFAVAFVMTNCEGFQSMGMTGTYENTKITPTAGQYRANGNFKGWIQNDYTGNAWIDGLHSGAYNTGTCNDPTSKVQDGGSFFDENRISYAKAIVGGYTLTGETVIPEAGYDEATDEFVDIVMPGTYMSVACFTALEDIDADNLYQYFHFDTDNVGMCGMITLDGSTSPLTFGPASDTPQPTKVTYTFADGSTQELDADAAAPANTAAVTAHVDGTETHKVTTYSWVADGDNAFKEAASDATADCTFTTTAPAVDPVHSADGTLTDGKTAVETCDVCGYAKGGETVKAEHSYVMTHVDATCLVKAHDHYVCSVCGDAYDDNFTGELADHKWVQTGSSAADCQTPGTIDYECEVCHETKTETGAYGAHKLTAHAAVDADCTNGGNEAYWTCDVCGKMFADAEGATEITEIPATPAKGHTLTAHEAVPATCTEGGNDAYWTCDVCGKMFADAEGATEITEIPVTSALGHDLSDVAEIPATRADDGVAAGKVCSRCDYKEGFEVIPALGVNIEVKGSSLGTAAVNGETVANAVKNVKYAENYTLVAAANEGAKFIGWQVGGKLVSTDETYTTAAFADMTYIPVFAEDTANAFEITFVDAYDNVITTVSSADLPLAELPAAPEFAGLTFDAWSLDLDAVNALTKAEKVTATYKNVEDKIYTVTAPEGCTITVNGEAVASPAAAAYNDTVTVTSAGAQGWSVNGSAEAAAYGETYTFYCGSDITVAPITDAVTAVPTVKMVSDNADGYKVKFLATRSIPDGYTLIESGFVYGKGMTADDLKLENVGKVAGSANGTVKQAVSQNKSADGQFALTYGVKNMDVAACAVAYVICSGANGTQVYYSTASVHAY